MGDRLTKLQVWVVINKDDPTSFWNNELGWTVRANAQLFNGPERQTLYLPLGGLWESVYSEE